MEKMTAEEFNKVETLELIEPCRVKEHGADLAKAFDKGAKVKVSGNSKMQLLGSKKAKPVEVTKGK